MRRIIATLVALSIVPLLSGCVLLPAFLPVPNPAPSVTDVPPTTAPYSETGVINGILGVISSAGAVRLDDTHAQGQIEATEDQISQFAELRGLDVLDMVFDDYGYYTVISVDDVQKIIGADVYQIIVDGVAEMGDYEIVEWLLVYTDPSTLDQAPIDGSEQSA